MNKSTQQSKESQIKAYQRIQSGYYNGKTIPPSVQRQANKGQQLIASGIKVQPKKVKTKQPTQPTQPKPISVSTSKTQIQPIQTSNKKLKAFSTNITLNFAKPINSNTFKSRYNYLLKRILSSFKNFKFKRKMQCNIKSNTIFKDNKGKDANMGNSTGNQNCTSIIHLKNALNLQFDLIGATCINSLQYISFIDLTITIYEF